MMLPCHAFHPTLDALVRQVRYCHCKDIKIKGLRDLQLINTDFKGDGFD